MGYISSATISGLSRADGTTPRTITMQRVSNVVNGFVLRESGVSPDMAQRVTYRTDETRSSKGLTIRNQQSIWEWPYDVPAAPGVVAGTVQYNKTGIHFPSNCPVNTRLDIYAQLANMVNVYSAGTIGLALYRDPMINGNFAF